MNHQTAQLLQQFQCELKAPKGKRNNFGGYNYRSAEDILMAVKPLEEKMNVCIFCDSTVEGIGNHNYHKVTAHFVCEYGEATSVAYARESETKKGMDDAQISGASLSYAKKYALGNLLNIDDSKYDPDATNKHGKDEEEVVVEESESINYADEVIKATLGDEKIEKNIVDNFKVKSIYDLNDEQYKTTYLRLQKIGKIK